MQAFFYSESAPDSPLNDEYLSEQNGGSSSPTIGMKKEIFLNYSEPIGHIEGLRGMKKFIDIHVFNPENVYILNGNFAKNTRHIVLLYGQYYQSWYFKDIIANPEKVV